MITSRTLLVIGVLAVAGCTSPAPTASDAAGGAPLIDLEPLWSVGERPGEELLVCSTDAMLAATRAGDRFYLGPTCTPGQVAVLDGAGVPTGVVGSAGGGPGELQPVATIFVDADDRLHVFQFGLRHTVFDRDGVEVFRSDALNIPIWATFPGDGISIRNFRRRSAEAAGQPLHRVDDATDEVLLSFGAAEEEPDPDDGRTLFRSLAPGEGDTIWSARHSEYVLEEWSSSGERLRTIRRDPEWWVPHTDSRGSNVWDISLRDGLLWTLAIVATPTDEPPSDLMQDPDLADYLDTVIEVLDPETGALVAQLRRDEMFIRWVGDLVYSHRNLANGGIALDVWRVRLLGGRP